MCSAYVRSPTTIRVGAYISFALCGLAVLGGLLLIVFNH